MEEEVKNFLFFYHKTMEREPTPESIDSVIERLLDKLETYTELYSEISLELQGQWYDAEMEARAGKDREAAKTHLEEFLNILEAERQKRLNKLGF